ncbi:MAG: hypothetical protein K6G91_14440 [Kiritimatiellae bacterium]|nr:hypothetical protein [Kiritimatiellia bacterium]
MYDTTIAAKLLGQLDSFLGRISPHFHKPVARFIGDMMYGSMAEKDVKLTSVVRLKERYVKSWNAGCSPASAGCCTARWWTSTTTARKGA